MLTGPALAGLMLLSGCAGMPPVNTATISTTSAPPAQLAVASRFLRICERLPDADAMFTGFAAAGHDARQLRGTLNNGTEFEFGRTVSFETADVIVQASETSCYVGVKGMTPEQSVQLAQLWVRHFDVLTNAELGQGLSDHVVQAWQARSFPHSSILIAAYKTWPRDRGRWPDEPGAAVTLVVRPN